jgi:glycosyltransferase involved in cell wall biosynthesis
VLTSTFPAAKGDGTPEFVLTLAEALAKEDSITVVAPRVAGGARRERVGQVEVRRFAYFPGRFEGLADGAIMPNLRSEPWRIVEAPFLVLAMLFAAWRAARETRPDVVHAHWLLPAGLVAVVLRGALKVPFVLTVHGADAYVLRGPMARVLRRVVVRRASAAVPVSRDIAARLAISPETVVPMGVDATAIRRAVGTRAPEPGRALFVGRLAEKKGVDVLLDALSDAPAATLRIAGDGPLRAQLEAQLAASGLGADRVAFLGRIGHDRVIDELAHASVFVIPSKVAADGDQEGTPVVLAEAMAAGVSVLASALGGIVDHVVDGETGILVPPDDPRALGAALQRMLADPVGSEALGRHAQERLGPLDVEQTRARYSDLYAAAIEDLPSGGAGRSGET